jgi:predicted signal transduction protein with EAL and GGDEF domain
MSKMQKADEGISMSEDKFQRIRGYSISLFILFIILLSMLVVIWIAVPSLSDLTLRGLTIGIAMFLGLSCGSLLIWIKSEQIDREKTVWKDLEVKQK